ncbi:MAG: glycosyltransferase family 4 protein [Desulfatibacillaceae bacterium]|nr:glycosyltransferase family 4 protein [Desulfatibacillaceae bacterium]
MKICFVLEYYAPHVGGGETLFVALAQGLAARGHSCVVVTARTNGANAAQTLDGVRVYRVAVPKRIDRHAFTALGLPKTLALAKRADIIHTMTYNAAPLAWLAGKILKKPVVLSAHEVLGSLWFGAGLSPIQAGFFKLAEDALLNLAFDAYSCNSQSTLNALAAKGIDRKRLHLIYPGVDLALFSPQKKAAKQAVRRNLNIPQDAFVCLYFGRPGVFKALENLVEAASIASGKIANLVLVMILSPQPVNQFQKIRALAANAPPGLVKILAPVPRQNLPGLVGMADCVCVSSLSEGFGFTAAEAIAMEIPVVATRAGSLPEVVSSFHLLVEPGSAKAFAEGIVQAHRGNFAFAPKRLFPIEQMVEKHEKLYGKLI